MSKNIIYVITMYRFSGSHSYVLGVDEKKHSAQLRAEKEEDARGGTKYSAEIIEFDTKNPEHCKVIKKRADDDYWFKRATQ